MATEHWNNQPAAVAKTDAPPTSGEVGLGARRIDISKFGPVHPGGAAYIKAFASRDASDVYLAFHPSARATAMQTPYAHLVAELEREGLFKPSVRQRLAFASDLALFLLGAALTPLHPAFAVLLALGVLRLEYTQHDIFHGQWHPDRRLSALLGNLLGPLTGATASWWRDRDHDPHHFFCNGFPEDPNDFLDIPIWGALALPGIHLYLVWCSLRDGTTSERLLSLAHLGILALLLGPAGWAVFLFAYMVAWVPFQLVHHPPRSIAASDWVTSQVLNTQVVVGSAAMRWLMAGHDLQLEHHLFPRMPRHRLVEAARATAAFCEANGLPRRQLPFFEALRAFCSAWWNHHVLRRPRPCSVVHDRTLPIVALLTVRESDP
jgi:fatty acid desaturase